MNLEYASSLIRTIPDWPEPGISFKDLTPLLADSLALASVIDTISELGKDFDLIAGVEARGFIFASAVAIRCQKGFIPIRKKGKLPHKTFAKNYGLEYGLDTLEIHIDALKNGDRILLIDDVLATGGTINCSIDLLKQAGAKSIKVVSILEIPQLQGTLNIKAHHPDVQVVSLMGNLKNA